MNEDLWPSNFARKSTLLPRKILLSQAQLLGDKTDGYVTAEIQQLQFKDEKKIAYGLNLIAPALNWYRVRICNISHSIISIFPVTIWSDFVPCDDGSYFHFDTTDEEDFVNTLKTILQSQKVIAAIESLIAQSEGLEIPKEEPIPF